MNSKNTHKTTTVSWNTFTSYLGEKEVTIDPYTVTKQELNNVLKLFYLELRKTDGTLYKKSSLVSIRHGLQRKFKECRMDLDIISDVEFSEANTNFKAQCVQLKKNGLGKTEHKPSISSEDVAKLYESGAFSVSHPVSLQRKVFFEIMLFFCRRGRENLRNLTKDSFQIQKDSNGVEYVKKVRDELTKNHGINDECEDGGVLYATGGLNCPVASFKLYLQKLHPKLNALFQRPKNNPNENGTWYDMQVIGVKSIERMMKRISVDANLSAIYTNHCIRATSISVLDGSGFEARHIMSVSGHRSESSIRCYSKTDLPTKRKMSENLSSFIRSKQIKPNFTFGVNFDAPQKEEKEGEQRNPLSDVTDLKISDDIKNRKSLVQNCDGTIQFSNCVFNL